MFHLSSLIPKCQIRAFKQRESNGFYVFFLLLMLEDTNLLLATFPQGFRKTTIRSEMETSADVPVQPHIQYGHAQTHKLHSCISSNLSFLCVRESRGLSATPGKNSHVL